VYADVFEHPPPQLASQRPISSDMTSVDTITQWKGLVVGFCGQPHYCKLYSNQTKLLLPTLLSVSQVSISILHGLMNCRQGPRHANMHRWGITQSPSCDCGQRQTMNHIAIACQLTKFEGGLNLLHEADDDAVTPV